MKSASATAALATLQNDLDETPNYLPKGSSSLRLRNGKNRQHKAVDTEIEPHGGIKLSEHQMAAGRKLVDFLNFGAGRGQLPLEQRLFLLTGYAGTGKTTVLSVVMKAYILALVSQRRSLRVGLVAIPNKAVKVMRSMAFKMGLYSYPDAIEVQALTACSLLGLKAEIDENGRKVFVPNHDTEPSVSGFDIILFDEVSMLGTEMHRLLMAEMMKLFVNTKIIFCGDRAQLPPIGEKESCVFTGDYGNNFANLTEVVRYDGAVGETAKIIRSTPQWGLNPAIRLGYNTDKSKGVFAIEDEEHLKRLVSTAFRSARYAKDSDAAKVLCYTNKEVAAYNAFIHEEIYGKDAPRFSAGMKLIANKPVLAGERTVIMPTSSECRVLSAKLGTTSYAGKSWKVWRLEVEEDGNSKVHAVNVLHEEEYFEYQQMLTKLSKAKAWRDFWSLKKLFADLRYVYAITVHKSQGSTYKDAFVMLGGILQCRSIADRKSLAYVAFSRPSHRVFYSVSTEAS